MLIQKQGKKEQDYNMGNATETLGNVIGLVVVAKVAEDIIEDRPRRHKKHHLSL